MAIEKREVSLAKEVDDVMVLVLQIVKDAKAGKDAGQIASGAVPALINALAGIDQIGAELKADQAAVFGTIGLRVGDLASVFLA